VIAEFISLRRAELVREMQAIYELLALETSSSEQKRPDA
jgi:tRNA A22 N-methylase